MGALPCPGNRRTALLLSALKRSALQPVISRALADADIIMLAPSNPVVLIGAIMAVPGFARRCEKQPRDQIGYSPIIGEKPLRGMADTCLSLGVDSTAAAGRHYGARCAAGYWTAGWCTTATTLRLTKLCGRYYDRPERDG